MVFGWRLTCWHVVGGLLKVYIQFLISLSIPGVISSVRLWDGGGSWLMVNVPALGNEAVSASVSMHADVHTPHTWSVYELVCKNDVKHRISL